MKGKATKVGTTAAGKTTVKDKKAVKGASYYAVAVSKDGKAVRPLLDEVVSVDDGDVYTVDGRCNGGFLQPGS